MFASDIIGVKMPFDIMIYREMEKVKNKEFSSENETGGLGTAAGR